MEVLQVGLENSLMGAVRIGLLSIPEPAYVGSAHSTRETNLCWKTNSSAFYILT